MSTDVAAAPIARPVWRTARLWLVLVAVVALGALLVGTLSDEPGRALDIGSAHKNGSKALARLLEQFGVGIAQTSDLDTALAGTGREVVVVTEPDEYSDAQLAELARRSARLVLVRPDSRTGAVVGVSPVGVSGGLLHPFCTDAGAVAAGAAEWPSDTARYVPGTSGTQPCYDNALLVAPRLAVLGSADVLRNDHLGDAGVAAMDINAITDSRRLTSVVWLLPGSDASGPGSPSIWDLFPSGTARVIWWLVIVGVILVGWRSRRLGAVVTEPLPVVVRSAELVEGHGRLYARAGARGRAADALRAATVHRLGHRMGLPRQAGAAEVAAALAPVVDRPAGEIATLLSGPAPRDDAGLVRLARELDRLEAAAGGVRKGNAQ
jgi:hypothetical protein